MTEGEIVKARRESIKPGEEVRNKLVANLAYR